MAFSKKKHDEKIMDVDASMQGNLSFRDPVSLRINGKFEGNLETRGNLTISQQAVVNADIIGDNVIVGGRVKGRIIARERLTLLPTAIVEGEIMPARLNVTEGAIFEGHCQMLHDLMSADELSRYLEVELNSLMDLANTGRIPSVKEGENFKFERKAIDTWIAQGKISH